MHAVAYWLGLTDAAGPVYLFWSGFFGNVSIFAGVAAFVVHKNCHTAGCWRIGGHSGLCQRHRNTPRMQAPWALAGAEDVVRDLFPLPHNHQLA